MYPQIITLRFFIQLLFISTIFAENCTDFRNVCEEKLDCIECIRAHHCCVWCYDENFSGVRCSDDNEVIRSSCNGFLETNKKTASKIDLDKFFVSDYSQVGDTSKVTQIKPQAYDVKLRKDEPINITFSYKPCKNYPLDFYYLTDLTYSMAADLMTMTHLGVSLSETLKNITRSNRIGFGSYVDKPAMPYFLKDPDNWNNPCGPEGKTCQQGYLFKHKLNFTDSIDDFSEKVNESYVSANLDDLEGGLDALMQIILCGKKIGWLEHSRKLVLLVTDSKMHLAGDGLLSGSVRRNRRKCLIDQDGNYTEPLLYDYPSLEELYRQLVENKIYVIFAAKNRSYEYYQQMGEQMKNVSFVGYLEEASINILSLVEEGYKKFISTASWYINNTRLEEVRDWLDVEFYADCNGNGIYEKNETCSHIEEEKESSYKVQLTMKKYPENERNDNLIIEGSNLHENVTINVEYIGGGCKCQNSENRVQCEHGKDVCGQCKCDPDWTGSNCNSPCNRETLNQCRYDDNGTIFTSCFGNGECNCGKCECRDPFVGKYCNKICPIGSGEKKQTCSGHGRCSANETDAFCICDAGYTKDDCSCSLSKDDCKISGATTICNGHGSCECNGCKCYQGYRGRFCEICHLCQGYCNLYTRCVAAHLVQGNTSCTMEEEHVDVSIVKELKNVQQLCFYRYDKNGSTCEVQYTYRLTYEGVNLEVTEEVCQTKVAAALIILYVTLPIVLIGALLLAAYKLYAYFQDTIEYKKFERERQKNLGHQEMNPLYKSPVTQYYNPMSSSSTSRN